MKVGRFTIPSPPVLALSFARAGGGSTGVSSCLIVRRMSFGVLATITRGTTLASGGRHREAISFIIRNAFAASGRVSFTTCRRKCLNTTTWDALSFAMAKGRFGSIAIIPHVVSSAWLCTLLDAPSLAGLTSRFATAALSILPSCPSPIALLSWTEVLSLGVVGAE